MYDNHHQELLMKTLNVYASIRHQNTEKVAKAMAEVLGADLVPIGQVQLDPLTAYDLIRFGSGIYYTKFDKTPLQFVERSRPSRENGLSSSTSGDRKVERRVVVKELLEKRGLTIVGNFSCKARDT